MFPTAYEAEIRIWIDHLRMVIDMNVSKLETIEQIREFLNGTAEVSFTNAGDQSMLRTLLAA